MTNTVLKRWASSLVLAWAALSLAPMAVAQEEPPGRVARLSVPDAAVQWAPAGSNDWQEAEANWPLTSGDRIRIPAGEHTELQAGATTLRLQGPAQLDIGMLDDANVRLTLNEGSLNLAVRELAPDERIEVGTANLAMVVERPGEFRIDADPASGTTSIGVRSGAATVYGENGESSALAAPRLARYGGRQLQSLPVQGLGARDGLDQWAAERTRAEEQSISARYVSRDTIGYQDLDAYGDWVNDGSYGAVWYPRVTVTNWAPYRYGQWRWVDPWGWTWIDDARWGFAPFHYGRWVQTGPRWGWVPGPITRRPAYAPALVGFVGTPGRRPPSGRVHTPGSDWFPLAPGEAWRPGFGVGPRYLDRVNRGLARPDPGQPPRYQFQRRPDAVSSNPLRDIRTDDPVRSTRRERPPTAMPGPQPGLPNPVPGAGREREGQDRRDGGPRDPQAQWQRQQQLQNQSNDELHRRHEQVRQEQQQRESSARQQQRMLQDQQMQQLRQQQEHQQRQLQEPQRQHDRFMRDQQEALQRQMQRQQQQVIQDQAGPQRRQPMAPPPGATPPPDRPNAGDNRQRPEGRERRQDRER